MKCNPFLHGSLAVLGQALAARKSDTVLKWWIALRGLCFCCGIQAASLFNMLLNAVQHLQIPMFFYEFKKIGALPAH